LSDEKNERIKRLKEKERSQKILFQNKSNLNNSIQQNSAKDLSLIIEKQNKKKDNLDLSLLYELKNDRSVIKELNNIPDKNILELKSKHRRV